MDDVCFDDKTLKKERLNKSIASLGCSPVKCISKKDRVSYGKRKLSQVATTTQQQIADVLEISPEQILTEASTEKTNICCKNKNDMDSPTLAIKEKLHISSNTKKIELLTLVPNSWTYEKAQSYFSVSRRMIQTAWDLKRTEGIVKSSKETTKKNQMKRN